MRDCKHCKYLALSVVNGIEIYACEKWDCEYEPEEQEEETE